MGSNKVTAHTDLPAPRPSDVAIIDSFKVHLNSESKSPKTMEIYLGAARLLARWARANKRPALDELGRDDMKCYKVWMRDEARTRSGTPFSPGYQSNQFRALQALFKWWTEEEETPNPTVGVQPPRPDQKLVPVLDGSSMELVLGTCARRKDHDSRRDYAILRVFLSSGVRLAELTELTTQSIDLGNKCAIVKGKGAKYRTVPFDFKTAESVDRYLRVRGKHKLAGQVENLWLGTNQRGPLTPNGIRQMIRRRARSVGLEIHPHMFRHTFSHNYLDSGGAEGDLMAINGWESHQMLRRYGASAKSARARRAYDRLDVMRGL